METCPNGWDTDKNACTNCTSKAECCKEKGFDYDYEAQVCVNCADKANSDSDLCKCKVAYNKACCRLDPSSVFTWNEERKDCCTNIENCMGDGNINNGRRLLKKNKHHGGKSDEGGFSSKYEDLTRYSCPNGKKMETSCDFEKACINSCSVGDENFYESQQLTCFPDYCNSCQPQWTS